MNPPTAPSRATRSRAAERGSARLAVTVGVLLVLSAGLAAWWQSSRRPAPGPELPPPDVIERALERADADSLALKTRWVDTVPDLDVSVLDPGQRETFVRFVNARFCECGCGYTLGACRNFDPTCPYSGPLVTALLDSVRAGHSFDLDGIRPRPAASERERGSG